jgi:hypothetical protein
LAEAYLCFKFAIEPQVNKRGVSATPWKVGSYQQKDSLFREKERPIYIVGVDKASQTEAGAQRLPRAEANLRVL